MSGLNFGTFEPRKEVNLQEVKDYHDKLVIELQNLPKKKEIPDIETLEYYLKYSPNDFEKERVKHLIEKLEFEIEFVKKQIVEFNSTSRFYKEGEKIFKDISYEEYQLEELMNNIVTMTTYLNNLNESKTEPDNETLTFFLEHSLIEQRREKLIRLISDLAKIISGNLKQ